MPGSWLRMCSNHLLLWKRLLLSNTDFGAYKDIRTLVSTPTTNQFPRATCAVQITLSHNMQHFDILAKPSTGGVSITSQTYRLKNKGTSLYLDLKNNNTADNAYIIGYKLNDPATDNQKARYC